MALNRQCKTVKIFLDRRFRTGRGVAQIFKKMLQIDNAKPFKKEKEISDGEGGGAYFKKSF